MQYPNVLIVGSQNVKEEDRFLKRDEIRPVQLLNEGEFRPIPFFNEIGEFGVCAISWDPSDPLVLFYSTGCDLVKLNLKNKSQSIIDIQGLAGVHEVDFIDRHIYIANTRFDEIIIYDHSRNLIVERINLAKLTTREIKSRASTTGGEVVDKYHCNQIFKG